MVTANELLASVTETDRTFIIDSDLRTIKIPANITNLGVQSDDDVLTVYFQMPGTYCGVNLSEFNIRINYLNAAGEGDYHDVDDAAVQSDGTIRFSWTIGRHAASVVGTVEFNVCLKKSDSSGNVIKEFNTTTASLPILEGLEISEQVISEYNDILEQWRAKLFGVGDTEEARILAVSQEQQQVISEQSATVLSDIELKGSETLATIPDTYTEVYNMAEEALRTKADAIVLEAEGTAIAVNDASDDHLQNLKLFGRTTQVKTTGKNLFDIDTWLANSGIVWNKTGTKYTITTKTPIYNTPLVFSETDVKITLSCKLTNKTTVNARFELLDSNDNIVGYFYTEHASHTCTASKIRINWTTTGDVEIEAPQIELGETATAYEPYTGGMTSPNPDYPQDLVSVDNPVIDIYGKNLWNHEYDNVDLDSVTGWGNAVWNNDAVTATLRPNTKYTMSFDVTALEIPEYETVFGDNCGFTLFSDKASGAYIVMAQSMNEGAFTVGEKRSVKATFTTPSNLLDKSMNYKILRYTQRYITSDGSAVFATVKFENVQLELGDAATNYESCVVQSLTFNRTLPGIPVPTNGNYIDADGQQWVCDEVDFNRGVYIQRIRTCTLTGTETVVNSLGDYAMPIVPAAYDSAARIQCVCSHYPAMSRDELGVIVKESNSLGVSANFNHIRFADTLHYPTVDIAAFKRSLADKYAAGDPVKVSYILATPIETPLASEEILAYKKLKTNRTNTTVLNDQNARMAIAYSADTLTFLRDNQPKPTDEQMTEAIHSYLDETGIELIPGPKGDKGDKGDPGDDYVLTESDKTEMVNAVLSALPTWEGGSY